MRVLLTGVAGFLGSHLADRLIADGHAVVGVDNLSTGRRSNIAHLAGERAFRFIEADAAEPLAIEQSLDWVLHLASPSSPERYLALPMETLRVNAEGTRHLLELARGRNAAFLLASTSEVYGDALEHPQVEAYRGNVDPVGPRSVYDEGKRYAEAMTSAFHGRHGLPVRICRIFNTYGPRMAPDDGRVIPNLLGQALDGRPLTIYGDGLQTRSFQYVDDLVEGIVRLMAVDTSRPVNLGNPEEHTMLELAELVRELTGTGSTFEFLPLPEDDPRRRRPDISLARDVLGWQPTISLRDGLARTVEAVVRGRSDADGVVGAAS